MKNHFYIAALSVLTLSACANSVPGAMKTREEQEPTKIATLEARFCPPSLGELAEKTLDNYHVLPSVEVNGDHIDVPEGLPLFTDAGKAIDWKDVGYNYSLTLYYDDAGQMEKGIVHGSENPGLFLHLGRLYYWHNYLIYESMTSSSIPGLSFLYREDKVQGEDPDIKIAMILEGSKGYVEDVARCLRYEEETFYVHARHLSNFRGYYIFE